MQGFLRKLDIVVLAAVAILAIFLVVGDIFKWLGAFEPQFAHLSLLLLALIGLHLIVTHFTVGAFQRSTSRSLQAILRSTTGYETRVFKDAVELEQYLGKRILEAKGMVCDLSWKKTISEGFGAKHRQLAHEYMDTCIREASERIAYREIFVFTDPRRLEKLERRLAEGRSGYSCRYFRDDKNIPRLQFVIVDDDEVVFFASSADAPLCAVKGMDIARIFKAYYETAWAAALPIKTGSQIHEGELKRIRDRSASS